MIFSKHFDLISRIKHLSLAKSSIIWFIEQLMLQRVPFLELNHLITISKIFTYLIWLTFFIKLCSDSKIKYSKKLYHSISPSSLSSFAFYMMFFITHYLHRVISLSLIHIQMCIRDSFTTCVLCVMYTYLIIMLT